VRVCFLLVRVRTPSSPVRQRETERGREREKEKERKGERVFIFKRNDGCLGTLAPFSYLVMKHFSTLKCKLFIVFSANYLKSRPV
jgi:hypothetical protein